MFGKQLHCPPFYADLVLYSFQPYILPAAADICVFSFLNMFPDLVNIFEVFIPQLLLYPNPSDPLNGEAAALMMRDRTAYEQRVKGNNPS